MNFVRLAVMPLSRLFISALFLVEGLKNIFSWDETERNFLGALMDWQARFGFSQDFQVVFAFLISWSSGLLIVATAIILLGGTLVLLGKQEKLGMSLLCLFLIPITILYHPFWWVDGSFYEVESALFLKNLAIFGCLLKLLCRENQARAISFSNDSLNF